MGHKEVIHYFDDISGEPLSESELNTVKFGYSGTNYEIDLSAQHLEEFEKVLEPYISSARKLVLPHGTHRRRSGSSRNSGPDSKDVRAWAIANGKSVNARGKLPASLIEEYKLANPS